MEIDLTKKLNLIQGDCLEIMKTFADNTVDVVITDPP
jgi:DNA modification methylase